MSCRVVSCRVVLCHVVFGGCAPIQRPVNECFWSTPWTRIASGCRTRLPHGCGRHGCCTYATNVVLLSHRGIARTFGGMIGFSGPCDVVCLPRGDQRGRTRESETSIDVGDIRMFIITRTCSMDKHTLWYKPRHAHIRKGPQPVCSLATRRCLGAKGARKARRSVECESKIVGYLL